MPSSPTRRTAARRLPAAVLARSAGRAARPLPQVAVEAPARRIEWLTEVEPLLDRRCTVCHACDDAP